LSNIENKEKLYNSFVIYIPAYNAALTLPKVFERIPVSLRNYCKEILVIDNCSADNTSEVTLSYKQKPGFEKIRLIRNEKNLGYGGSQKLAYSECIKNECKGVIMLHGDAQYAPELAEMLLEPIICDEADMVFGSRMTGSPLAGGMPIHRYLGNRFLTKIQNLLLNTNISEFHSGYRVFSLNALKKVPFYKLSSDYHFDTEILILFLHNNLRIVERPIPTHYGDEECYVNIWKYGLDVLVSTITYYLHKKKIRYSERWAIRLN